MTKIITGEEKCPTSPQDNDIINNNTLFLYNINVSTGNKNFTPFGGICNVS